MAPLTLRPDTGAALTLSPQAPEEEVAVAGVTMRSFGEIQAMLAEALVELEYLRETRSLGHRAVEIVRDKAAIAASDARRTVGDLEEQVQEVERRAASELSVAELKLGLAQTDAQTWQHRAAVLQVRLDSAGENVDHLRRANSLLGEEHGEVEAARAALQSRCAELQAQLRAREDDLQTARSAAAVTANMWQTAGAAAESAQAALAGQLQQAHARVEQLQAELAAAVGRAAAAEARVSGSEARRREQGDGRRAGEAAAARAAAAEARAASQQADAQELRRQLAKRQAGEAELSARVRREAAAVAELQKQVEARDAELEALRRQLRARSEDAEADPMGEVASMLDQLCPSPRARAAQPPPPGPGDSPAQAASDRPAAPEAAQHAPAAEEQPGGAAKQPAKQPAAKKAAAAKGKAPRGRKRPSSEPETAEEAEAAELIASDGDAAERPRRLAKKAQPYWIGGQAAELAQPLSPRAPDAGSRDPMDGPYSPPAKEDARKDAAAAAPPPPDADGEESEQPSSHADAAASDDTRVVEEERPAKQAKGRAGGKRAAPAGGQKAGAKRSRLGPQAQPAVVAEEPAAEPQAAAEPNAAAEQDAAAEPAPPPGDNEPTAPIVEQGEEQAPEAARGAKDRRSGRPQGISKIDLRTVWGSNTPAAEAPAPPPAGGAAAGNAPAAAAAKPPPSRPAEGARPPPGTRLESNPLAALNPAVLQAARVRAQAAPPLPPAAQLGARRSHAKPPTKDGKGKKALQPGAYMGRGLAQDLLLGPPGGFKVPRLKKPAA